jgi:hypothetical protein
MLSGPLQALDFDAPFGCAQVRLRPLNPRSATAAREEKLKD